MTRKSVSEAHAWNFWTAEYPAEMVHLPSGVHLSVCAYADSVGRFTRFPAGQGVRLGPREIDASRVQLELSHAGTTIDLDYARPDVSTVRGAWRTRDTGEWGLRVWVLLVAHVEPVDGADESSGWRYEPKSGVLSAETPSGTAVIKGARLPLLATFHDSVEALADEMERYGYFYLESRGTEGRVAALRYNLEEMREFAFAAAIGASLADAERHAATALEQAEIVAAPPLHEGLHEGALDAVRDVIAWNSVWDTANERRYTSLSRNWVAQKFGGWGVWLNDVLYHALMAGQFDAALARDNLKAVFAGQTEAGNLPCLVTGRDAWIDRSQPPIGGLIVWMLYLRGRDRSLLELAYPVLRRNHAWWWRARDGNGNGLLEYGTSALGDGLYKGTRLGARNESMMDNSPVHDEAELVAEAGTLDCEDVALNSLLALDGEMLSLMAAELGDSVAARDFESQSAALKARIRDELWDEGRGVFANRLWNGHFVRSLAPTSFFPLIAGAATEVQAAALVKNYLQNPERFGGAWWLPSVSRDDPAFADNVYWRGRIWPPLNFLTYYGLRRYGFDDVAAELAENGNLLFMGAWRDHRHCAENFNATTGEASDQPDTDLFYAWGALLPCLAVADCLDVNPWEGFAFTNDGGRELELGPINALGGDAMLEVRNGILTLCLNGEPALRSDIVGRFRQFRRDGEGLQVELPARRREPGWIRLPGLTPERVEIAELSGQALAPEAGAEGVTLAIPPGEGREGLEVRFRR